MNYPKFFDEIETIKLKDDLSNFLGSFQDGLVEFSYLEIVKAAGHSCPTVAGAYLSLREGLKTLYKDNIPRRGEIVVEFKEDIEDGVAGVIANVATHITGATSVNGFKGIGGRFSRCDLLFFNSDIESSMRLSTIDNKKYIDIFYDPSIIPPKQKQKELLDKIMLGTASREESIEFGKLWQERVEKIFKNVDKVISIK